MTLRQLAGDGGGGEDDFHPGELARSIDRMEKTLERLEAKVVVQSVYEAEKRETNNIVNQLALRVAEDRARFEAGLAKEIVDRERWQAGMVNRIWWLAALVVTTAIAVVSLISGLLK